MAAGIQLQKKIIFLFKSSYDGVPDKYSEAVENAGNTCCVIPTLSFKFVHQDILRSHVASLHMFSVIIFTSVRAVQSVTNVMKDAGMIPEKLICFVIGQITAEAAKKAGFNPVGAESNNAQNLSSFIFNTFDMTDSRPMLYPCSNIRRDTLSDSLKARNVALTEVIAYETCPNEQLEEELTQSIQTHGVPSYAVFFSPSCFQYVQPLVKSEVLPLHDIKLIALGPATDQAIRDLGYNLYAVTDKPSPDSLLQCLRNTQEIHDS